MTAGELEALLYPEFFRNRGSTGMIRPDFTLVVMVMGDELLTGIGSTSNPYVAAYNLPDFVFDTNLEVDLKVEFENRAIRKVYINEVQLEFLPNSRSIQLMEQFMHRSRQQQDQISQQARPEAIRPRFGFRCQNGHIVQEVSKLDYANFNINTKFCTECGASPSNLYNDYIIDMTSSERQHYVLAGVIALAISGLFYYLGWHWILWVLAGMVGIGNLLFLKENAYEFIFSANRFVIKKEGSGVETTQPILALTMTFDKALVSPDWLRKDTVLHIFQANGKKGKIKFSNDNFDSEYRSQIIPIINELKQTWRFIY